MTKICTKCSVEKPLDQYHKHKNGKFGLAPSCKSCMAEKYLKYKTEQPQNLQASRMKTQLKRFYKMTPEEYKEKLEQQNNVCAICGTSNTKNRNRLFVDHDHACCPGQYTCGKCIRGLVCDDCNLVLGRAKDNVEILQNTINYLMDWRENGNKI